MTSGRRVGEAELHAFVDGELTPEERAEVEALLATAPTDQAVAKELREINEALRARYACRLEAPLPAGTAARLARFGRRRRGLPLRGVAAAVALAFSAGAAGYLARDMLGLGPDEDAAFVATALGAHRVYMPEKRHAVEVGAGEAHLVRWLANRVGADVRAPALTHLGWKLMGGRLLPGQGGLPVAQFMYQGDDGRRLTLYIRKETGRADTSFQFYERDGVGAFYWIDRPLAYALAGRVSRRELTTLARAVYDQLDGQR